MLTCNRQGVKYRCNRIGSVLIDINWSQFLAPWLLLKNFLLKNSITLSPILESLTNSEYYYKKEEEENIAVSDKTAVVPIELV